MSMILPVESVSDTAFLTAFCRALESERRDGLFRDPYARMLAGSRGEQLLQRLPGWEFTAHGCTVRTHLLDSLLLATIREGDVDAVVNLGAGLDTRPFRLILPPFLRWFEVDNPKVLAYKATKLAASRPACILESVPLDVSDAAARRAFFARIAVAARHVLVLTEGLLVYMKKEEVVSLARDLHFWSQFRWWLSDLVSPAAFSLMAKGLADCHVTRAVMLHFAPEEGSAFFSQYGWETEDTFSCLEEGQRLGRSFLMKEFFSAKLSKDQMEILLKLFVVVKLKRAEFC